MLQAFAADPENLNHDYEAWLAQAERNTSMLKHERGFQVVKIPVQVRELMAWCKERGLPLDGSARARYIVERTQAGAGYPA
jgi:hypothetical protein